ncbi:MAG: hypothetical protein K6F55_05655 [Eubacterium sp.]|nr:hypothetical protein [Eubacterium sp.]
MTIFNIMFIGGLILAILFLIAAAAVFYFMDIPKAYGVVTGKAQKKAIEEIRTTGRASKSKRGKGSSIITRDIDVTNIDNIADTSEIPSPDLEIKASPERSSDASESIAKKAAEDAKAQAAKTAGKRGAKKPKDPKSYDEESTEVLTYNEMKNKDTSEDPTSVLEEEQPTDVLTAQDDISEDEIDIKITDEEEATDVLAGSGTTVQDKFSRSSDGNDEEVTDVLKTKAAVQLDGLADDIEEDMTDVLSAETPEISDKDVYGVYNPETTSVLKSEMAPGKDSVPKSGHKNLEGITFIYSETIVHTTESL